MQVSKEHWIIFGILVAFCIICLLVAVFKKPQPIAEDSSAIQQARMEQYREDSVKYYRVINAMAQDRNRIDSLYKIKERNNEQLWKKLQIEMARIKSMPPDSINILFTGFTECPPSW